MALRVGAALTLAMGQIRRRLATPASPLSMRRSHTRSDSRGRPRALERPARVRVVAYCFPCLTSRSYPIMPKKLVHVDGNWRQPTPSVRFTFCPTINLASTMFDTGHKALCLVSVVLLALLRASLKCYLPYLETYSSSTTDSSYKYQYSS